MKILLLLLFISFNVLSQELTYPESMKEFTNRPEIYKLDKVMIEGKEYVGKIARSQSYLVIDLEDGTSVTGSLNNVDARRVNYIIEDNRQTRKITYELTDSKINKKWIEAFPIINRKSIKNGFPVIIDDGIEIAPLSGPDKNPILINTPMALVNLFEAMDYKFIGTEVRPTKSTPLVSGEVGNIAATLVLGIDFDDYEDNSIVYVFKKN